MAREQQLIPETREARPKYELTQSTHADVLVDTIIEFLRQVFSNHPLYTYVRREDSPGPDFELTKIVIVDKYTEDALFLPTITMSIDNIQTQWLQFSQSPFDTVLKPQLNLDGSVKRDQKNNFIPSHYEYAGLYKGTLSFQISASSTIEREELANFLQVIFAESGRDTLYTRGVFVTTVNAGSQSETEYRNDFIFQQPMSVEFMSDWRRIVPVGDTLQAIGFDMTTTTGEEDTSTSPPITTYNKVEVFDLETSPFVIDPSNNKPIRVDFKLSATSGLAPIALVFSGNSWKPSSYWREVLRSTLIPFANFTDPTVPGSINIPSSSAIYLQAAGKALIQASVAKTMASTQGRTLPDGTVVLKDTFVYTNGRVDLRNFASAKLFTKSKSEPLNYHITVQPDDTVIMRLSRKNPTLVAKNLVLDAYGDVTAGELYKRLAEDESNDILVTTNGWTLINSDDYDSMSTVDFLMILIYGDQPYRFSLNFITTEIDKLLVELADTDIAISNRIAKINNISSIKQLLIQRSETYLLRRPSGL